MAGNTGKMTAEALRARGPRMCVTEAREGTRTIGVVIRRENEDPFRRSGFNNPRHVTVRHHDWAKSYTLSYVLNIARGLRSMIQ